MLDGLDGLRMISDGGELISSKIMREHYLGSFPLYLIVTIRDYIIAWPNTREGPRIFYHQTLLEGFRPAPVSASTYATDQRRSVPRVQPVRFE